MKRERFTEPQVVFALRQEKSGTAVEEKVWWIGFSGDKALAAVGG